MIARILFDGLWQGALVAAVALAVVRAVPSRDATTRYAIWFAALLALVAVPILAALSNTGALLLAAARPQITDGRWTLSLIPVTSLAHGGIALSVSISLACASAAPFSAAARSDVATRRSAFDSAS